MLAGVDSTTEGFLPPFERNVRELGEGVQPILQVLKLPHSLPGSEVQISAEGRLPKKDACALCLDRCHRVGIVEEAFPKDAVDPLEDVQWDLILINILPREGLLQPLGGDAHQFIYCHFVQRQQILDALLVYRYIFHSVGLFLSICVSGGLCATRHEGGVHKPMKPTFIVV